MPAPPCSEEHLHLPDAPPQPCAQAPPQRSTSSPNNTKHLSQHVVQRDKRVHVPPVSGVPTYHRRPRAAQYLGTKLHTESRPTQLQPPLFPNPAASPPHLRYSAPSYNKRLLLLVAVAGYFAQTALSKTNIHTYTYTGRTTTKLTPPIPASWVCLGPKYYC
jgi:hypothetical protein